MKLMISRFTLVILAALAMSAKPAAAATITGFGPKTSYPTQDALKMDFRKTSSDPWFSVGTYKEQPNVVRSAPANGNLVYAEDGFSSENKTYFDISNKTTFSLDFYIESTATGNRIGLAAVNSDETHSFMGSFYTESVTTTTAVGYLRFEDFNFSLTNTRNSRLDPVSTNVTLETGIWYRLALEFSNYEDGVVDVDLFLYSLSKRGGEVTGTIQSLSHAGIVLSNFSLGNEVQYGVLAGAVNAGRILLDGFQAQSIPEAGTMAIVGVGFLSLLVFNYRRGVK